MVELNTDDTETHCRDLEAIGAPEELQIVMLERFIATFEGGSDAKINQY